MNTIDIISLVLISLFTLIGLWRGFLRGIFRLAAWIAAIAGAYFCHSYFGDTVSSTLQISDYTTIIVCASLGFLVPFLAVLFIGHIIGGAVEKTAIGHADRVFGAFFGCVKAFLICFVFTTVLHLLPLSGILKDTRNESVTYTIYIAVIETMGFSSDPVDIVGFAEKKASELTSSIADKAVEGSKDVVEKAKAEATEAAKEAVNKATTEAKNAAISAVEKATEKATEKASEAPSNKAVKAEP